jgi:hypothetical protein
MWRSLCHPGLAKPVTESVASSRATSSNWIDAWILRPNNNQVGSIGRGSAENIAGI